MDSDKIERALTILVEEQDHQNYPMRSLALSKMVDYLDNFITQLREIEENRDIT